MIAACEWGSRRRRWSNNINAMDCDVVVLGAGAAGLACARALRHGGASVVVVEARDRAGGRLHTLRPEGWPFPVEAGAEFVHGHPDSIFARLKAGRLRAGPADGRHDLYDGGRLQRADDLWERAQELLAKATRGPDRPMARALREQRGRADDEVLRLASHYVEGFHAADLKRIGSKSFAQQQQAADKVGGDRIYRLRDGYSRLVDRMARDLGPSLLLGTSAARVRWGGALVEVETRGGETIRAARAVITVPLSVLQSKQGDPGHIEFDPPLPRWKRTAIGALRMGPVVKVALLFREAPYAHLRGFGFLHVVGAPLPTFWRPLPFRAPALVGWAAGPKADRLRGLSSKRLIDLALRSIGPPLGRSIASLRASLLDALVFDWQRDPLARGAYSWVPAGALGAQFDLARPVGRKLHFAGEAAHFEGASATVHGALETGERAAADIVGKSDAASRRPP